MIAHGPRCSPAAQAAYDARAPYYAPNAPAGLSGPSEGAAPLVVVAGLLGAAALVGWLLWPSSESGERMTPNRDTRYGDLRERLRSSKDRARRAAMARERQLDLIRQQCHQAQQRIKRSCAIERQQARSQARDVREREKRYRQGEWAHYREIKGRARQRQRPAMSHRESDSLAEHSVPPELVGLWQEHRGKFSYDQAPDARAEKFLEWVEEHPEAVQEYLMEQWPSDQQLARQQREQVLEEVPF